MILVSRETARRLYELALALKVEPGRVIAQLVEEAYRQLESDRRAQSGERPSAGEEVQRGG